MSIVYDYLKKIHDQKEPSKGQPAAAPGAVPIVSHKRSDLPLWGKTLIALLVCFLIGVSAYAFLSKWNASRSAVPRIQEKPQAVVTGTPDFDFLLEGIIYNPSRPFAIIDGKMYEVGGKFDDFEIVEITPDTVKLKNLKDSTSRIAHL